MVLDINFPQLTQISNRSGNCYQWSNITDTCIQGKVVAILCIGISETEIRDKIKWRNNCSNNCQFDGLVVFKIYQFIKPREQTCE